MGLLKVPSLFLLLHVKNFFFAYLRLTKRKKFLLLLIFYLTYQNKVNHNLHKNSFRTSEITNKWNLSSCSVRFQLASHRLTHLNKANVATSYSFQITEKNVICIKKLQINNQQQQQQKHDKT